MQKAPSEKKAIKPDKALIEFSNTLHGQVMDHINDCLKNKNSFEAYIFSWALIEQILMKELIEFISKNLKVDIPSSLWTSNQFVINSFYLAISHDVKLYGHLDKGRKNRNKFLHELVNKFNKGSMEKETKKLIRHCIEDIIEPIFKRLLGDTPIPSLTLYSQGWNACRKKTIENIEDIKSRLL